MTYSWYEVWKISDNVFWSVVDVYKTKAGAVKRADNEADDAWASVKYVVLEWSNPESPPPSSSRRMTRVMRGTPYRGTGIYETAAEPELSL